MAPEHSPSKLPAGATHYCAEVAVSEAAPGKSPYVDTYVWGSGQPPITLIAGQQMTGIVFTSVKGALLSVLVADPARDEISVKASELRNLVPENTPKILLS